MYYKMSKVNFKYSQLRSTYHTTVYKKKNNKKPRKSENKKKSNLNASLKSNQKPIYFVLKKD